MAKPSGYELEQEADAIRERLVERLIDDAMGVLHHDRTEGSDVDKYERATLRKKFAATLDAH